MKKNSLLIDTLNEILKIIRTPFMIDDDKFESDDNQSDKESKHHKRQEKEVEENEYHKTNEDKEINQSLANIFRNHHPFLGIKAAIEIISSYYLKNDSINISIIKFIKEVINEVPKNFNITFTENDILQYIGLGNFGMEEIDQRRRGRLSKKKSQELEIYSEKDLDIINFPIYEEDYSDEGIFKDYLDKSKISSNSDDENVYDDKPHISEEKIQKYRKEILGNIHDCYTKEVWIVFKELFSKRVKKAFGDKINLDYPTDLGIGEGKRFLTSFQELSQIVPLTYINDFWVFKLNLGEYLVTHFEDKSIKIMIQSFNDADRIVTPRHFGGIKKRYSEGPPMI